jgi:hypothetical protein
MREISVSLPLVRLKFPVRYILVNITIRACPAPAEVLIRRETAKALFFTHPAGKLSEPADPFRLLSVE